MSFASLVFLAARVRPSEIVLLIDLLLLFTEQYAASNEMQLGFCRIKETLMTEFRF